MASDWTYIIKINTINRVSSEQKKEHDGSRNDDGDISVRFVVYQMYEQNDDHFAKRSNEIGGDDILVNGTVPFEDIPMSKLPPVYVPPCAESLRYPNHMMKVSYDYGALLADFSDDIWKRIGKQTDYICSIKERVV